jgi:hypothetical protein
MNFNHNSQCTRKLMKSEGRKTGGVAQMVEWMLCKPEALSSTTVPPNKKSLKKR